jgi:hypothetical protein
VKGVFYVKTRYAAKFIAVIIAFSMLLTSCGQGITASAPKESTPTKNESSQKAIYGPIFTPETSLPPAVEEEKMDLHRLLYHQVRYYETDTNGDIIDAENGYVLEKEEGKNYIVKYYTDLEGSISDKESAYYKQIIAPAQDAAADVYLESSKSHSFLWVKNIWVEDLPWKKAFVSKDTYKNSTFTYSKGCSCSTEKIVSDISNETAYDILMGSPKLDEVKKSPNGYLILVLLSIGSMLISQLIMTKSQKAQLELQTVDQSAQQTSKMMMWMMPIMFGVFSFMYTASFSLYLIVSTLFSMISTIFINKIVEKKFEKQIQKEEEEKYNKRFGYLNKK